MSNSSNPNRAPDPPSADDLSAALGRGDPQQVLALIEAGADIRYKRQRGYDALIDAVYNRDLAGDTRLLDLLSLLVSRGVDLRGASEYGETALGRLSSEGRFDAVQFLLDAGADEGQLGWTPLVRAVALGSLADVRAALDAGAPLEEEAWLTALLAGDLAKAKLLRERGADPNARGPGGRPALFYAIQSRRPDVVRWLLREGADVHRIDDHFGTTALKEAVRADDLECVEILLAAGANVEANHDGTPFGTALSSASSRPMILRLLDAGADLADLGCWGKRIVLGLPEFDPDDLAAVSPNEYSRSFTRTFGNDNPERMRFPFWEAMIRGGVSAYRARERFETECGPADGPVWCADRFGQSLTLLPDGRAVQIGGEHEDFYDPDFCIYNDVFVHGPDGSVAIYGYPEDVFPPTDFHTATLVDDAIYVIGSLGYRGTRRFGETPVYRLDLHSLRMERLEPGGDAPGWVYKHRAAVAGPREIRIWGGTVAAWTDDQESHAPNNASFVLDLGRLVWRRV